LKPAMALAARWPAAAVHWNHHIRRHRLQFGDRVLDILGWRDAEMVTAQHGMQFGYTRDRRHLSDRVDDATMAQDDHHQAASLHDTTRRMLIAMAVGDHASAPLNLAEVIGGRRLDVAAAR
jgi:hypothetical protein